MHPHYLGHRISANGLEPLLEKLKAIKNLASANNVTFGNIYQELHQYLCPHVDPHLSPPTAQQWVSMCIRLIWPFGSVSWYRNGITNAPEGFLCYFNEGPSPTVYRPILDSCWWF